MKSITKALATIALTGTVACFCARPAAALTVTTLSQATLPAGRIIVVQQLTLDPGDTVPWHYHSGPGWGSIVAGTPTEEESCGTPPKTLAAGSAFAEIPGKVHRVFKFGSSLVVFTWVEINPGCDSNGLCCSCSSGFSAA